MLKKICKELELGFNSNIKDTKDSMPWRNTNKKPYEFMDDIISRSYINDESYMAGYIDYYYCFNYVDVEKEMNRNTSMDVGIDTAGISALTAIGFSKYQATIIFNYIKKGGAIYTVKDLAKIYSIDQKTIDLTQSKIIFSDSASRKSQPKKNPFFVKKIPKKVELNSCDSASLDSVFYMSSYLAGRIISYRNRLGGFFELTQIQSIYGIDTTVYAKISTHLSIDTANIKRLDLNKVSLERLAQHPYIGYKLAKVMVNYRAQHGSFKSKSDLKKIILINEEIFRKIERYIFIQ